MPKLNTMKPAQPRTESAAWAWHCAMPSMPNFSFVSKLLLCVRLMISDSHEGIKAVSSKKTSEFADNNAY